MDDSKLLGISVRAWLAARLTLGDRCERSAGAKCLPSGRWLLRTSVSDE